MFRTFLSILALFSFQFLVSNAGNFSLPSGQPEVQHIVDSCTCVGRTGGKETPRLYMFDEGRKRLARSGLSHQISNLRAIIGEGLSMGRAVLLQGPILDVKDHNFNHPLNYTKWSDYISLERTRFKVMKGQEVKCMGFLSSCVAEVSASESNVFLSRPHEKVTYHSGRVPSALAASPGLLVRGPGPDVNGTRDSANLLKRLDGMAYQVELEVEYSDEVVGGAQPVIDELKKRSTNGKVAVVHARRGDKILPTTALKRCPEQMRKATSPEHIAKVLNEVGAEPGSAVYVMTDEVNVTHFEPLRQLGYHWATFVHFPSLRRLLEGCQIKAENGTTAGLCENYLLFLTEHEIMRRVPSHLRVETLAATVWNPVTSKAVLFHDFNAECSAFKATLHQGKNTQVLPTPNTNSIDVPSVARVPHSFDRPSSNSLAGAKAAIHSSKRDKPSVMSSLLSFYSTMLSPRARGNQVSTRREKKFG